MDAADGRRTRGVGVSSSEESRISIGEPDEPFPADSTEMDDDIETTDAARGDGVRREGGSDDVMDMTEEVMLTSRVVRVVRVEVRAARARELRIGLDGVKLESDADEVGCVDDRMGSDDVGVSLRDDVCVARFGSEGDFCRLVRATGHGGEISDEPDPERGRLLGAVGRLGPAPAVCVKNPRKAAAFSVVATGAFFLGRLLGTDAFDFFGVDFTALAA